MGQTNQVRAINFKVKVIGALMVSVWGLPAFSLELGRLQLQSAIGEPLRAEVEIAKALPEELLGLRVQVASPEIFRKAGMEFNPALRGVTATLKTGNNGVPVIVLNGRVPVQDNFVDLVIESQWATGNLVKNYAVLLNSVNEKGGGAAPSGTGAIQLPILPNASDTAASRAATTASRVNATSVELNAQKVPVYRFDPVDNKPPAPRPVPPAVQPPGPTVSAPAVQTQPKINPARQMGDTVTVTHGDTASRLAMRHMASHISLDQMLLAMLKANPEAFIQDNVNLIKAGAVLRMPSAEEAAQIPRGEARQTVIAQTRDFAEFARRLAESPMVVGARNTREMSGKVETDVQNANAQSPQQDKLTLSKPQVSLDSTEAKLAAKREAEDNEAQLAALNKNLKDLEALAQARPAASAPESNPDSSVAVGIPAPAPEASEANTPSRLLEKINANKDIWIWAVTLLGLMLLLVLWIRKKTTPQEDVFAPSYNDIPESGIEPSNESAAASPSIPPQMASIDLNLNSAPAPSAAAMPGAQVTPPPPMPMAAVDETENNKLNLAAELLAKGDNDLARALVLSVASSASGELKSRALQMLGQIR